jgi:hypothetical protein
MKASFKQRNVSLVKRQMCNATFQKERFNASFSLLQTGNDGGKPKQWVVAAVI